jgi:glycosyltransferase involved in cell wall biosynthesis
LGFVDKAQKTETYKYADIYILPSYYEGMPTTVIEAMAFGIPIITRNVGGLPDFFVNGVHGYITDSKSPDVFAGFIDLMLNNKSLMADIAINNYNYAQQHFLLSKVVKRVEAIFNDVI